MKQIPLYASALFLTIALCALNAQEQKTGARTPVLVELFTSEGCSSCPPVDEYIEKLDAEQPVPGAKLIVLSEHVDYFNHDGWTDPYSASSVTYRQYSYVNALKKEHAYAPQSLQLKDAYTPQVIVDGDTVLDLSNPEQVKAAFEKAATSSTIPIHLSDPDADAKGNRSRNLTVEIGPGFHPANASVYLAVALDHARSYVHGGENDGHALSHVAVLRSLKKIGELQAGHAFKKNVLVKVPTGKPQKIRIIVFIQKPGPGPVLGAAMLTTDS